ncbi:uncharacterized protein [Phyllobates terribilis]|uniref:uncharacterized protein n=1 Tax=Phyllobates terribilis TaxID=111132 RepID=UPI003CCB2983
MMIPRNLKEIRTGKITRGYYERGAFRSIEEISKCLPSCKDLGSAGNTMKENIESVISDGFLRVPLEFPVLALQHVTSQDRAKQILESESFKGRKHERPEFNDLSFWSADISSDDIEKARLQMYETMRMKVEAEHLETFNVEMKEQFANSPAFDKLASCYGNFKFSLPLSLLLCRYKTQHCKGKEPQLRILGTDIYKQEIAHYIVVHNPDTMDFKDLPTVDSETIGSQKPRIVTWMDETLHWRPQSTSSSLHLRVSGHSCSSRIYNPRRQHTPHRKMLPRVPGCVWNHLVFAFHLPNEGELKFPVEYLLRNLTPCQALQPFIKLNPILKYQAREMIRRLKKEILGSSQDSRKTPPPSAPRTPPPSAPCTRPPSKRMTDDSPDVKIRRPAVPLKKVKTKHQQKAPGPGQ